MSDVVEDAQMPPTEEDDTQARLAQLRGRFKTRDEETAPPSATPTKPEPVQPSPPPITPVEPRPAAPPPPTYYEIREQRPKGKPGPPTTRMDRKKFTIYLGEPEMQALENAYKKMAHDIYPLEIEKADYLEACFNFLCEAYQQDQIRKRLQDK